MVAAHPDDPDFGAAGSVARWVDDGIEVTYCLVTDGDAGGFDPSVPRSEIAGIRRAEQTAAAKVLGVTDLVWLGYPDGRLMVSLDLRRDIARVIRQVRPQRVLASPPMRNLDSMFASHPDHLAAGEATLCAVYPDARNPFTFPELADLEPHSVDEVWLLSGAGNPDTFVDITDTFDRKVAALRSHISQKLDRDDIGPFLRGWAVKAAEAGGLPEGRLAEGFRRLNTRGA